MLRVLRRCDGAGRVIGGLASLPGCGWFPIKVYRPCPELTKAGMSYVRRAFPPSKLMRQALRARAWQRRRWLRPRLAASAHPRMSLQEGADH